MSGFEVSVIIPNYNNSKYLGMCIDSMLAQSLKPNEIIIVDDCSTDDSRVIIKEYESKYSIVKGLFLEKNGGVSNARNIGAQLAESEYITFTDADDYYYSKDKLKNEMQLIKKYAERGIDILAYSAFIKANECGEVLDIPKLKKRNFLRGNVFVDLVARIKIEHIPRDYCIKKDILIQAGGYSFPHNFYEDLDLLFRLSKRVPFYSTYEFGIAYRMTIGGLSKRSQKEHIEMVNSIVNTYYTELPYVDKIRAKAKRTVWRIYRKIKRMIGKK